MIHISLKHTHHHRFCRRMSYNKMQQEREGLSMLVIKKSQIIHEAAWPDAEVHNQRNCLFCRALETGQLFLMGGGEETRACLN